MTIDPLGSSLGGDFTAMDRQTFGAQVVTKTLDYMNGQGSSENSLAPVDKASIGAAVVSKTLDYMNSGNQNGHAGDLGNSYEFQKEVLGAKANGLSAQVAGLGALTNIKI